VTGRVQPSVTATDTGFHVEAYEKIEYRLRYADGAFAIGNTAIADTYRPFGRCLMLVDKTVWELYGRQVRAYFSSYGIKLTVHPVAIPETGKTMRTAERIVDAFGEFGLLRKEPVLVVGGRADHRRGRLRLRDLPPLDQLQPGADHADRADRRQRRHQGGG
jgi:demethyl-4-deoxygadusol synthase